MKLATYPISGDPIHLGHLEVITKATFIFDEVIVLIATNLDRKSVVKGTV